MQETAVFRSCTTLDHIYPAPFEPGTIKRGTKCFCGKRSWGIEPKRAASGGSLTITIRRNVHQEEEQMATKKRSSKKSSKAATAPTAKKSTGNGRAWKQHYEFVKNAKDEPAEDTIQGCVYRGAKTVKSGTADEVTDAAVKAGLSKVTSQDARTQTMVHLRRLVAQGVVKVVKDTAAPAAPKAVKEAKATAKSKASSTRKRKVKLAAA